MELLQQGLLWAYILICFTIIWYGVALVLALWQLLARRRAANRLIRSGLGFVGAWSAAWLITVVGAMTATNA